MYKVIFYRDKEDAIPISDIVEAETDEDAKEIIGFTYPGAVIVSVTKL